MNDELNSTTVGELLDANVALKRALAEERAAHAALRAKYDATLEIILHDVRALRADATRALRVVIDDER